MINLAVNLWNSTRNYVVAVYNWLLDTGSWDDTGVWRDSAEWNDGV